jgi:hypothetical protein
MTQAIEFGASAADSMKRPPLQHMKTEIVIVLALLSITIDCASGTDTIGPPKDGVGYQVLASEIVFKTDAFHCGFNDLSFPNPAEYRRETRKNREYRGGKLVREWVSTVDVFVRCKGSNRSSKMN